MDKQSFWERLSGRQKLGLGLGAAAIAAVTLVSIWWTLQPDYVMVVDQANPDRLAVAVREIDKLKIPYEVSEDGTSLSVPSNRVGQVRMGLANGMVAGGGVGFEIFNNSDFSTTEFTQKVNYQRALQGELSRTIASIDGVSNARVHLVMPESGFMRRQSVTATAAVTVTMQPAAQLTAHQVAGIQRLIAAAVPGIKLKDIAVIDQTGETLTKTSSGQDTEGHNANLDVKREVDSYLEGKLRKLLAGADPSGEFNVSVDATLNLDDVKVTTEDVLPAEGGRAGQPTGVLVREKQSDRQETAGAIDSATPASGPTAGSQSREVEYRTGRRVEQIATTPGGIERLSVAVVARSITAMDESRVKSLVAHAIGLNEQRGDSVAVVSLPPRHEEAITAQERDAAAALVGGGGHASVIDRPWGLRPLWVAVGAALVLALVGLAAGALRARAPASRLGREPVRTPTPGEVTAITDKVRQWLDEGQQHAAR